MYVVFDGFSHHVFPSMKKVEIVASMDEFFGIGINVVIDVNIFQGGMK